MADHIPIEQIELPPDNNFHNSNENLDTSYDSEEIGEQLLSEVQDIKVKNSLLARKRLQAYSKVKNLSGKEERHDVVQEKIEKWTKQGPSKKSKKGLYPDDKAKATIKDIEDLKKSGQVPPIESNVFERRYIPVHQIPQPHPAAIIKMDIPPVINKFGFVERREERARSLSQSSEESEFSKQQFKKREIKCRNIRRVDSVDKRSPSPSACHSLTDRKKSESEKSDKTEREHRKTGKDVKTEKKYDEYPKNWTEYKSMNLDPDKHSYIKSKLFRQPRNKPMEIEKFFTFETPPPLITEYVCHTFSGSNVKIPFEYLKYTATKPSVVFSRRAHSEPGYLNRDQLLSVVTDERKEILENFWKSTQRCQPNNKKMEARKWHPKNWKKGENAEAKILENTFGLSFLQNYSEDEEEMEEIEDEPLEIDEKTLLAAAAKLTEINKDEFSIETFREDYIVKTPSSETRSPKKRDDRFVSVDKKEENVSRRNRSREGHDEKHHKPDKDIKEKENRKDKHEANKGKKLSESENAKSISASKMKYEPELGVFIGGTPEKRKDKKETANYYEEGEISDQEDDAAVHEDLDKKRKETETAEKKKKEIEEVEKRHLKERAAERKRKEEKEAEKKCKEEEEYEKKRKEEAENEKRRREEAELQKKRKEREAIIKKQKDDQIDENYGLEDNEDYERVKKEIEFLEVSLKLKTAELVEEYSDKSMKKNTVEVSSSEDEQESGRATKKKKKKQKKSKKKNKNKKRLDDSDSSSEEEEEEEAKKYKKRKKKDSEEKNSKQDKIKRKSKKDKKKVKKKKNKKVKESDSSSSTQESESSSVNETGDERKKKKNKDTVKNKGKSIDLETPKTKKTSLSVSHENFEEDLRFFNDRFETNQNEKDGSSNKNKKNSEDRDKSKETVTVDLLKMNQEYLQKQKVTGDKQKESSRSQETPKRRRSKNSTSTDRDRSESVELESASRKYNVSQENDSPKRKRHHVSGDETDKSLRIRNKRRTNSPKIAEMPLILNIKKEKGLNPDWEKADKPRVKDKVTVLNHSWESDDDFDRSFSTSNRDSPMNTSLEMPLNIRPYHKRSMEMDSELEMLKTGNDLLEKKGLDLERLKIRQLEGDLMKNKSRKFEDPIAQERKSLELEKLKIKQLEDEFTGNSKISQEKIELEMQKMKVKQMEADAEKMLLQDPLAIEKLNLEREILKLKELEYSQMLSKKTKFDLGGPGVDTMIPKTNRSRENSVESTIKKRRWDRQSSGLAVSTPKPKQEVSSFIDLSNSSAVVLENEYEEFLKAVSTTVKIEKSITINDSSDSDANMQENVGSRKKPKKQNPVKIDVPLVNIPLPPSEPKTEVIQVPKVEPVPLPPREIKPVPVPSPQLETIIDLKKPLINLSLSANVTQNITLSLATSVSSIPAPVTSTINISKASVEISTPGKDTYVTPLGCTDVQFSTIPTIVSSGLTNFSLPEKAVEKLANPGTMPSPSLTDISQDSFIMDEKVDQEVKQPIEKKKLTLTLSNKRTLLNNTRVNLDESDDDDSAAIEEKKKKKLMEMIADNQREIAVESVVKFDSQRKIIEGLMDKGSIKDDRKPGLSDHPSEDARKGDPLVSRERRKESPTPRKREPSPRNRDRSPKRRDASPRRHDRSPRRREPSPRRREQSPRRRGQSPRRRESPRRRLSSPKRRDRSPRRRDGSPRRRDPSPRRRGDVSPRRRDSPKRRELSPLRGRDSPKRRELSPLRGGRRSPRRQSPRRRSPGPGRWSPLGRSKSPRRRSVSPRRRRSLTPRKRSMSPRKRSMSPRKRSMSPRRRSISPRRTLSPRRSISPRRRSPLPPLPSQSNILMEENMRPSPRRWRSPSPQYRNRSPIRNEFSQDTLDSPSRLARNRSPPPSHFSTFEEAKLSVVPDSTISDDLLQQRAAQDEYSELAQYHNRFKESEYDSPKRVPLDVRINQVLGIESASEPSPTPKPGGFSSFDYGEQSAHRYDQYHHQVVAPPRLPPAKQFRQVGNMLQIVPSEPEQPYFVPMVPPPPVQHGEGTTRKEIQPQVVQMGNVLEIVPRDIVMPLEAIPVPNAPCSSLIKTETVEESKPSGSFWPVENQPPETSMMQKVTERRAEREKRRLEKEQRRMEKEKKREERDKKKQAKLKLKTENMIKKALEIELGECMEEENAENKTIQWPPVPLVVHTSNKEAGKSILLNRISEDNQVDPTEPRPSKLVQFADGVRPGEGTSPSAGEELYSPPRQMPKEKRFVKLLKIKKKTPKKKVKVKIIKKPPTPEESESEEDNLPPPSPPPGSPPPHVFPPRIKTAPINNVTAAYLATIIQNSHQLQQQQQQQYQQQYQQQQYGQYSQYQSTIYSPSPVGLIMAPPPPPPPHRGSSTPTGQSHRGSLHTPPPPPNNTPPPPHHTPPQSSHHRERSSHHRSGGRHYKK